MSNLWNFNDTVNLPFGLSKLLNVYTTETTQTSPRNNHKLFMARFTRNASFVNPRFSRSRPFWTGPVFEIQKKEGNKNSLLHVTK